MDYFKLTQTFIENTNRMETLRELAELFYTTIQKLGCTHFACLSHVNPLYPPEDAIVLSNYPMEWAIRHSEKNYHSFDPIFHTCENQLTPFTWSNDIWRYFLTFNQVKMLNEASEFGLGEGHTVPIHPPTGYAASCNVVFQPGEVDPKALMAIDLMSLYLYEAAIGMKTNHVWIQRRMLTDEQRIVLEYIAQGKSDWSISQILAVSQDAIKGRVKRIFKALNVCSRQQAIARALFLGEIKYIDVNVSPQQKSDDTSGVIIINC